MEYKSQNKNDESFIYKPKFQKENRSKKNKVTSKNNPFDKLSEIRFR